MYEFLLGGSYLISMVFLPYSYYYWISQLNLISRYRWSFPVYILFLIVKEIFIFLKPDAPKAVRDNIIPLGVCIIGFTIKLLLDFETITDIEMA